MSRFTEKLPHFLKKLIIEFRFSIQTNVQLDLIKFSNPDLIFLRISQENYRKGKIYENIFIADLIHFIMFLPFNPSALIREQDF